MFEELRMMLKTTLNLGFFLILNFFSNSGFIVAFKIPRGLNVEMVEGIIICYSL